MASVSALIMQASFLNEDALNILRKPSVRRQSMDCRADSGHVDWTDRCTSVKLELDSVVGLTSGFPR